jgi:Cys-tRNA(Pro)/Cys-tRNA(Cys) deacylase
MAEQLPHPRIQTLLISARSAYRIVKHVDLSIPIDSPEDAARALGYKVDQITKTLLVKCKAPDSFFLLVLPVKTRADLAVVADRVGAKRCVLATRKELQHCLDYPPMGVSPLASAGIKVFLDEKLRTCETVLVGSGAVGVEIEVTPTDLMHLTRGEWLPLSALSFVVFRRA